MCLASSELHDLARAKIRAIVQYTAEAVELLRPAVYLCNSPSQPCSCGCEPIQHFLSSVWILPSLATTPPDRNLSPHFHRYRKLADAAALRCSLLSLYRQSRSPAPRRCDLELGSKVAWCCLRAQSSISSLPPCHTVTPLGRSPRSFVEVALLSQHFAAGSSCPRR